MRFYAIFSILSTIYLKKTCAFTLRKSSSDLIAIDISLPPSSNIHSTPIHLRHEVASRKPYPTGQPATITGRPLNTQVFSIHANFLVLL